MKTHAFRDYEAETTINALIAATLVLFMGVLIIVSGYLEPAYWKQKLNREAYQSQPAVSSYDATDAVTLEKLREYLIVEPEPEFKLSAFMITTEENETDQVSGENEYLENLKNEKIMELEEALALRQKLMESLTPETEEPLQMESWMIAHTY